MEFQLKVMVGFYKIAVSFDEQGTVRRLSDSTRNAALPKTQEKSLQSSKSAPAPTKVGIKDSSIPPSKRSASAVDTSGTLKEVVLNKRWTDGSVSWDSLPLSLASLGKV